MDPSSPNDKVKFPEVEAETKTTKYFHLYNCDKTYKLDSVENLLKSIREKLRFDISIAQHYFYLREMSETCERINSEPQMDFAIFVVHVHEPDLSISEDNAGISYAKIYRALLQKTGEKVIVVLGGDDNYRNSTEEQTAVLSHWVYRKVFSQFDEQFLNGRKSFIFSWDKEHRPVHEEAMLHFFDPSKKGKKFVPEPILQSPPINPEDLTLFLKTRLRYGKISYDEKDVEERVKGWTAPQQMADQLLARCQSTINAELQISLNTKTGDHHIVVKEDENNAVNTIKGTVQSITSSLPSRSLHSFNPNKKGKKFVPQPKVEPTVSEVDPQKGVSASHESSKTNADETSNVIKEKQTSEGQEPETSSKQNETVPHSFEFVRLPQKQQETAEHIDTSDDAVVLTHDDVPKDDPAQSCPSREQPPAPMDPQVSLMHVNTAILYRDQSDIAYVRDLFGDDPRDKGAVTIQNPSDLKEFFSSSSVGSCFMFVEAKTMQEVLQKRACATPYEDLLRTVTEKVEKVVIFLCYNKFSQIAADAITEKVKERFGDKNVQILWKQNEGTNRTTFTRTLSWSGSEGQSTRSTKKGSGSSQAASKINPEDLTVLLKTRLRHGKISYDEKDVEERVEGWRAPQKMADTLLARWKSTINAELRISLNTKTGDHHIVVKDGEDNADNTDKGAFTFSLSSCLSFLGGGNTSSPKDGPDQ